MKLREWMVVPGAALAYWLLQAVAWPLRSGRDGYTYLYFFEEMFSRTPEDPFTSMFRTPVPAIFSALVVNVLGPVAGEVFMALLFAGTVWILWRIGNRWGRPFALALLVVLGIGMSWGSLFHVISNDPPMAVISLLVLWLALRASEAPQVHGRWVLLGISCGIHGLTRPGIFFLVGLLPLVLTGIGTKARILGVICFILGAAPLLGGWMIRNQVLHGEFTMVPGGAALVPAGRLLSTDKLVHEENGSASQKLAVILRESGLAHSKESAFDGVHYFEIAQALRRSLGPGQYGLVRDAAWEALVRHPWQYLSGVAGTLGWTFFGNLKLPVPLSNGVLVHTHKGHMSYWRGGDQWVPWDMAVAQAVAKDMETGPKLRREVGEKFASAFEKMAEMPIRSGAVAWGTVLNFIARWWVPLAVWVFLGVIGIFLGCFYENRERAWLLVAVLAFATNVVAALSMHVHVYEYRISFDPIYIGFGLLGVFSLLKWWKGREI